MHAYRPLKNSPVRLRNKKLSSGSNDSFYDQPYSSVDELGSGFSSFTPPPPPDFRNDDSCSDPSSVEIPQEFSNQLYKTVRDQPITEEPGYAQPEGIENATTPPPPSFPSDFEGVANEGYDTDEELDRYLADMNDTLEKESQPKRSVSPPSRSPTSLRSQSTSPPAPKRGQPGSNYPDDERHHSALSSRSQSTSPPAPKRGQPESKYPDDERHYSALSSRNQSTSPPAPKRGQPGSNYPDDERHYSALSSRSQSVSPPALSQATPQPDASGPVYAQVDKTKKKKKSRSPTDEHDAVVVYDERTNL